MTPLAMLRFLLALILLTPAALAQGQTYDQRLVGEMLDRQGLGWIPAAPIPFERHVLDHPTGNTVLARHALYEIAGNGDVRRGRERLALTLLLNGVALTDLALGDTLVLPARPEDYDLDPLSFAPFPREYPGAKAIPKVVVVDKDVQAWAAYEHGWLARWGPSSTGAEGTFAMPSVAAHFGGKKRGKEEGDEAVKIGRAHSDADEGPHVPVAGAEGDPAPPEKRSTSPEDDGSAQDRLDPARGRAVDPVVVTDSRKEVGHGEEKHGEGEHSRDKETATHRPGLLVFLFVLVRRGPDRLEGHAAFGTVAGTI